MNESRTRIRILMASLALAAIWAGVVWGGNADDVEQLLTTNSCPGCDLSGEVFEVLVADGANLAGANLAGAELYRASLIGAVLTSADLTGAWIERVDFTDADLSYAVLIGANLRSSDLTGAVTTGVETDPSTICPDDTAGPCTF